MQMLHVRSVLPQPEQRGKMQQGRGAKRFIAPPSRDEEETDMTRKENPPAKRDTDTTKQSLERTEELTDLLHRLDSLRDQERMQLSRELHDTLVSTLSATKVECDWLVRRPVGETADRHRVLHAS